MSKYNAIGELRLEDCTAVRTWMDVLCGKTVVYSRCKAEILSHGKEFSLDGWTKSIMTNAYKTGEVKAADGVLCTSGLLMPKCKVIKSNTEYNRESDSWLHYYYQFKDNSGYVISKEYKWFGLTSELKITYKNNENLANEF